MMKSCTHLALAFLLCVGLSVSSSAAEGNKLRGSLSPYLLQHANNPVHWYPWGPEALAKAQAENKPIFVSVGYSSCHWCHVMRKESFENETIAAFLNAYFVAIKIDREIRPDLDDHFQIVTQLLSGGGGWPNSVFLTPAGDPYFAGGYWPAGVFARVLSNTADAWRENPAFVGSEAAKVTLAVKRALNQSSGQRSVPHEEVHTAATSVLDEMDVFYGGLGTAPKFPREPLFLFLLDQANRSGNSQLLSAVTDMLDGMIAGGIHDHVGGGFHRYAVDPEWHVPHFEKMLYTQALTGRLLLRAFAATSDSTYKRAAERTFDYVLRDLTGPHGGFYTAQDADSLNQAGASEEGAYYSWTQGELNLAGAVDAEIVNRFFRIVAEGPAAGGVLTLTSFPEDAATIRRLDTVLSEMADVRAKRPAPFLDRKVVLSWNAVMIATLAEASRTLDRPDYFNAAERAARFLTQNLWSSRGLQRIWYAGAAQTGAQLADYAALGLAFVALHDFAPNDAQRRLWLDQAMKVAGEIPVRFGGSQGGFKSTERGLGLTDMVVVDDGTIPSPNAMALSLFARLATRTERSEFERTGLSLMAQISEPAINAPENRAFALKAIEEMRRGETGAVRFAANGAVRVDMRRDWQNNQIAVHISIAPGWHINAAEPLQDYLIATDLVVSKTATAPGQFPTPLIKTFAFSDEPLAVYEGAFSLSADIGVEPITGVARSAVLSLQACSDKICLQPEELIFRLW